MYFRLLGTNRFHVKAKRERFTAAGGVIVRTSTTRKFTSSLARVDLSRLCSATFEQFLAFGATACGFSNLEQVLPFRAISLQQIIALEHIYSTKNSTKQLVEALCEIGSRSAFMTNWWDLGSTI